jgi:hypothetical protein
MKEILPNLIESLREELKESGEMLALLDRQQQMAGHQPSQDLLQYAATLHAQSETVAAARREREQRQRQIVRKLGLPEATAFVELLPHLPADYRPLLEALAQDNQESLLRVHQHAQQNHLLFNRIAGLMGCLLGPTLTTKPGDEILLRDLANASVEIPVGTEVCGEIQRSKQ